MSSWNHEAISSLIDAYQARSYLYDLRHCSYHNRVIRIKGEQEIADIVSKVRQKSTTSTEIKKKLQNLRSCYSSERTKYLRSLETKNVYTPQLWYFQKLSFLIDYVKKRTSIDDAESAEEAEPIEMIDVQTTDESLNDVTGSASMDSFMESKKYGIQTQGLTVNTLQMKSERKTDLDEIHCTQNLPTSSECIDDSDTMAASCLNHFLKFVEANLIGIRKTDIELYIDTQEGICKVIYDALRQANRIHAVSSKQKSLEDNSNMDSMLREHNLEAHI